MPGITIRFGNDSYELIRSEARHEGITLTAFIREAALTRAAITKARRGDYDTLPAIWDSVRHFLTEERRRRN